MREKQCRWLFDGDQSRRSHFENPQLVCRTKSILDGSYNSMRVLARSFKIQNRIDDMLERLRTGQRAVLRDVADQKNRHVMFLRPEQELRRYFANLTNTARRHLEFFAECRLD